MLVTKKHKKTVQFMSIPVGKTFLSDEDVFLRVNTHRLAGGQEINCVKLQSGSLCRVDPTQYVTPDEYQVLPLEN